MRAYQVERLLSVKAVLAKRFLTCADVRPEVLAYRQPFLSARCNWTSRPPPLRPAAATVWRLRPTFCCTLDDRALFAAMAGLARSLCAGGYFVHNDVRFATKAFGEVLGLPAVHFEALALGRRQGVEQMDRVLQQSDNVPLEQSRNVPLTDPRWCDATRRTTDDTSR